MGVKILANKVKLQIGGSWYTINTEEEEEYIRALGDELNSRFKKLTDENQYLSPTMVACIAALQYCDEAKKRKLEIEELRIKAKSAEQIKAEAKIQVDNATKELERITRENRILMQKLEQK